MPIRVVRRFRRRHHRYSDIPHTIGMSLMQLAQHSANSANARRRLACRAFRLLAESPSRADRAVATVPARKFDFATISLRRDEAMAEYDLTLSRAAIPELLEQPAALGRLAQTILNQVLEAQMSEHLGADRYERNDERKGYRNGYRERQLATRIGATYVASVANACQVL